MNAASVHNVEFGQDAALAWSRTGALYLSYVLAEMPVSEIRQAQSSARDSHGPIVMECKWYDYMVASVFGDCDSVEIDIPAVCDVGETRMKVNLTRELFLEMLDFCREGF